MATSDAKQGNGNVWTAERIKAQGVQMDSKDAVRAVFKCGTTRAYEALRSGEDLGFRVMRLGRRYVTPTADVLRLLGLSETAHQDDISAA